MKTPIVSLAILAVAPLFMPHAAAQQPAPGGRRPAVTAPYDELTNTYRSVTNFNVETIRGMTVASSGELLLINTHGSTLNIHMVGGSLAPDFIWPTINNPISLGTYVSTAGASSAEYALVLGGGTHALALHDLADGHILDVLQLEAEPGDLVIDQENDRAFVSIPGNNTVVQVGLPQLQLEATFEVKANRPRFLFLDRGVVSDPTDNVAFVAPELSGNNSVSSRLISDSGEAFAIDLGEFSAVGLPDEDLFRITPVTATAGQPQLKKADPMLRTAGTLMMAHARHPGTGEYWMVGTDALNTLPFPGVTTEPGIKGTFQRNQLVIAPTLWDGVSPTLPVAPTPIDLDFVSGYAEEYSVSFPYALEFHGPTGYAVIAGSASDQLRIVDQAGSRVGDMELPPGSIPRDLLFSPDGAFLFVYCWGTNEVRVYDSTATLTAMAGDPLFITQPHEGLSAQIDLGIDPNAESIKRGREAFYDGDNSLDGRTTCNHCHPGGGMDLLGWNISNFPHDHKDLMVTQSLKSIEDTFPYHWRGERDLEAFNGAFSGLLGGQNLDETEAGELEDFKMFVFSLQGHANPRQDTRRILNSKLSTIQAAFNPPLGHTAGNPVNGQLLMDKPNVLFGRFSCADCHGKPSGTVGDPQIDDVSDVPANQHMDVAHFRQLFHKDQDLVTAAFTVNGIPGSIVAPRGGFGLTHDGEHPSTFDFLHENPFAIDDLEERDLAAFVEQADEGISPAAHMAYKVDQETPDFVFSEIKANLITQAGASLTASHWVSMAIIGWHEDQAGAVNYLRWFWFPGAQMFFCNDPTIVFPNGDVGAQSWDALRQAAAAGTAEFTILGLPPGNAFRFAADRDDDGATDYDELMLHSTNPFDPDTDGDGDPDGHEILNGGTHNDPNNTASDTTPPVLGMARVDTIGSTFAKVVVLFSEPVTLKFTSTNPVTGNVAVEKRFIPRLFDTVTLQRLEPSLPAVNYLPGFPIMDVLGIPYPYSVQIEMTDLSGNTSVVTGFSSLQTRDQLVLDPFGSETQGGHNQIPPALLSRTVEAFSWNAVSAPNFDADITVEHRFAVPEVTAAYANPPNSPNRSSSPLEKQVVVAQVLHYDASTDDWSVLSQTGSGLTVGAPPGMLHDNVYVRLDPTPTVLNPPKRDLEIPGPMLLSTPTDNMGDASFSFTVNGGIPSGDKIKLNVVAILEQDERDMPGVPPNEFWFLSAFQYNKPVTDEAMRGIEWTAP